MDPKKQSMIFFLLAPTIMRRIMIINTSGSMRICFNNSCYRVAKLLLVVLLLLVVVDKKATGHTFTIEMDKNKRTVQGHFAPNFGFAVGGVYNLTVHKIELKHKDKHNGKKSNRIVQAGFLLKRFHDVYSYYQYVDDLYSNNVSTCDNYDSYFRNNDVSSSAVDDDDETPRNDQNSPTSMVGNASNGILLSITEKASLPKSIMYKFKPGEEGEYFLIYQICPHHPAPIETSCTVTMDYFNYDYLGNVSHLSIDEIHLPLIFMFFALCYLIFWMIWVLNLQQIQQGNKGLFTFIPTNNSTRRPVINAIHHYISVMIFLQFLNLVVESIRYHYLKVADHALFWTISRNLVSLTEILLLIGVGSIMVQFMMIANERRVIAAFVLQIINYHMAQSNGGSYFALFFLVELFCCFAVVLLITRQISALEGTDQDNQQEARIEELDQFVASTRPEAAKKNAVQKLKLFRSFYLSVVVFLNSTRALGYLLSNKLDYQHTWLAQFCIFLAMLVFSVYVAFIFRPTVENSFFSLGSNNDTRNAKESREGSTELVTLRFA